MSSAEIETVPFPIADIRVVREARQRKEAKADEQLRESIRTSGLINPIVVKRDGELVAGERRFEACKALGLTTIRASIFETLSRPQAFLIEFQENVARKALSWQEQAEAIATYHEMKLQQFAGWNHDGTANDLGIGRATVTKSLTVAAELADPEVAACPTFSGAFNLLTGRAERARAAAISRNLAGFVLPAIKTASTPAERTAALLSDLAEGEATAEAAEDVDAALASIQEGKRAKEALAIAEAPVAAVEDDLVINADFVEWSTGYAGPLFDVLHIDFPYGIGYSGARTRRTGKAHIAPRYADDPDIYFALLEHLFTVQDKLAFPTAHCLFWFDMRYYAVTVEAFQSAGWTLVADTPFIWTKGYAGIASDVKRRPRHCYETCLLFQRGDRRLVKLDKDHYEAPIDEKLHINQKPLVMLKHLLRMFVDEHTAVLDPTCGSGSALAAARAVGSPRVLGVELERSNAEIARFVLRRGES